MRSDMDNPGHMIRIFRNRLNVTIEELSAKSNVAVNTISNYERNRTKPRPATLRLLIEALQLDKGDQERLMGAVHSWPYPREGQGPPGAEHGDGVGGGVLPPASVTAVPAATALQPGTGEVENTQATNAPPPTGSTTRPTIPRRAALAASAGAGVAALGLIPVLAQALREPHSEQSLEEINNYQSNPLIKVGQNLRKSVLFGGPMNIYSDFPYTGNELLISSLRYGIDYVIQRRNGEIGNAIVHVPLDYGRNVECAERYDIEKERINSRKIARDKGAIGCIGPFNSGVAGITIDNIKGSVPVVTLATNSTIHQTALSVRKEPWFFQILPIDNLQGLAMAAAAETIGAAGVFIIRGSDNYAIGLANDLRLALQESPTTKIIGSSAVTTCNGNYEELIKEINDSSIATKDSIEFNTIVYMGVIRSDIGKVWSALRRAFPKVNIIGSEALFDPTFLDYLGKEGMKEESNTYITIPNVPGDMITGSEMEMYRNIEGRWSSDNKGMQPPIYLQFVISATNLFVDAVVFSRARKVEEIREYISNRVQQSGRILGLEWRFQNSGITSLDRMSLVRLRDSRFDTSSNNIVVFERLGSLWPEWRKFRDEQLGPAWALAEEARKRGDAEQAAAHWGDVVRKLEEFSNSDPQAGLVGWGPAMEKLRAACDIAIRGSAGFVNVEEYVVKRARAWGRLRIRW